MFGSTKAPRIIAQSRKVVQIVVVGNYTLVRQATFLQKFYWIIGLRSGSNRIVKSPISGRIRIRIGSHSYCCVDLIVFMNMCVCVGFYDAYNYSGLVRQVSGFITVIISA